MSQTSGGTSAYIEDRKELPAVVHVLWTAVVVQKGKLQPSHMSTNKPNPNHFNNPRPHHFNKPRPQHVDVLVRLWPPCQSTTPQTQALLALQTPVFCGSAAVVVCLWGFAPGQAHPYEQGTSMSSSTWLTEILALRNTSSGSP
jgi:hypothetical protein